MIIRDHLKWEPNKAINIVPEVDIKLTQLDKISSGSGVIEFRWSPIPGYYFIVQCEDKKITKGDAELKGEHIGDIKVKVRWIKNENGNLICEGHLNLITEGIAIGDKNGKINYFHFYLPNFGINSNVPLPLEFVNYKNWEVRLKQFENIASLFETLDRDGGYAFTYECLITHSDRSLFTCDQALFLIDPLRIFSHSCEVLYAVHYSYLEEGPVLMAMVISMSLKFIPNHHCPPHGLYRAGVNRYHYLGAMNILIRI